MTKQQHKILKERNKNDERYHKNITKKRVPSNRDKMFRTNAKMDINM